ncbi:MAG: DMT family transporter [Haloarculaceae archaeon]
MDDETKGILLLVASGTSFGTLGIFGKLAAGAGLSIPTVLAYRFLIGSLAFWAMLVAMGRVTFLRGRSLGLAVLIGSGCYALQSGLYFWGLEFMTAGLVGIVVYTYPVFVLVLSALVLEEHITGYTVAALTLALGGVALITGADPAGADPRGVAVVLGAAVVYAVYYVLSHATLADVDTWPLTAHVLPAAAASFVVFGATTGQLAVPGSAFEWGVLTGLGVLGTAVPIGTFFAGLGYVGASRASIISSLEPASAVVLGLVVLGEPVAPTTVLGGALVLVGVLLIERE